MNRNSVAMPLPPADRYGRQLCGYATILAGTLALSVAGAYRAAGT
jgi:hypothetical protein